MTGFEMFTRLLFPQIQLDLLGASSIFYFYCVLACSDNLLVIRSCSTETCPVSQPLASSIYPAFGPQNSKPFLSMYRCTYYIYTYYIYTIVIHNITIVNHAIITFIMLRPSTSNTKSTKKSEN